MNINRRSVIKSLIVFTGWIFLLPACMTEKKRNSIVLKNIKINDDQEILLQELSETILPENDTPGAKKLGLHLFILKMVDDCYPQIQRKAFTDGLINFEENVKAKYGKRFPDCDNAQKKKILLQLEAKTFGEKVADFYTIAKKQLINGYTNSEYFMTNICVYELVPGRYNGYFKAGQNKA